MNARTLAGMTVTAIAPGRVNLIVKVGATSIIPTPTASTLIKEEREGAEMGTRRQEKRASGDVMCLGERTIDGERKTGARKEDLRREVRRSLRKRTCATSSSEISRIEEDLAEMMGGRVD